MKAIDAEIMNVSSVFSEDLTGNIRDMHKTLAKAECNGQLSFTVRNRILTHEERAFLQLSVVNK